MLFEFGEFEKALFAYDKYANNNIKVCLLCDARTCGLAGSRECLNLGGNGKDIASNLYYKLREGEEKFQIIIAVAPEIDDSIMAGVMNRLTKACRNQ